MRTKTRLTALLISVLMIFAMLPLAVFAADGDVAEVTINGTTTGYASIGAAWVAAQKSTTQNATVKLLADCQLDNYYRQTDYIITLDLNGHVLKAAEGKQHFGVWVDATLTITDSNPTAEHWYTKDATTGLYTLVEEGTGGAFMIPGGVITGGVAPSGKNGGAIIVEGGTLYVEGGNFIGNQAPYGGAIFGGLANRAYQYDRNLKEIEASTGVKWEKAYYGCQVYISGGTFVGNVASSKANDSVHVENMNKEYTIPNNVITDKDGVECILVNVADAELTGGVFSDTMSDSAFSSYLADRYELVQSTLYGITVTEVKYQELDVSKRETPVIFRGVQRSTNSKGEFSLRLVAEMKLADIQPQNTYAGFIVTANGKTEYLPIHKYYTSLIAQSLADHTVTSIVTPTSEEYVLLALILDDISERETVDIYVQPYIRQGKEGAEQYGDKALIRVTDGQITAVEYSHLKMEYQTLISTEKITYRFLAIDGEDTLRGYFGRYTWLPDKTGFICGQADGDFYYYNIDKQELVYLDCTVPDAGSLQVYVNPKNGLVYYIKKNATGHRQLWSVDPQTGERVMRYEATNTRLEIGIEVTNDGCYTYYCIHPEEMWVPNAETVMGRINLQTGTLECEQKYSFAVSNHINHLILNPEYPNLLLFHHEIQEGVTGLDDRLNIMDLSTGNVITYSQLGSAAAHAMWTRDGEYVTITDYSGSTKATVIDKTFNTETRKSMQVTVNGEGMASHFMVDGSNTWAIGDGTNGVALFNLGTNQIWAIDLNHKVDLEAIGKEDLHPYHPHPEITSDGMICSWGEIQDGVLGIAWLDNPQLNG